VEAEMEKKSSKNFYEPVWGMGGETIAIYQIHAVAILCV
jgi:hypothetical protein